MQPLTLRIAYYSDVDISRSNTTVVTTVIETVVQPDVYIISDLQKVDARGLRGAPAWLAEVLSPGTARHDQLVKLPAYERAGVREVWLIHPTDRTVTIYRLEGSCYGRPTLHELKGKTQLIALPGLFVDWDLVVADISPLET